jgi:hypothetical protein
MGGCGEWRLKPKREAERDKQMRKIDDAEQYALVADISGYYECLHCPTKRIFLKSNEVWKYGVTNQGEKQRYTTQFLEQRVLRYLVQLRGTYSQCLVAEKRKLFEYPILPENLAKAGFLKDSFTTWKLADEIVSRNFVSEITEYGVYNQHY